MKVSALMSSVLLCAAAAGAQSSTPAAPAGQTIRPKDVVTITVADQPDLTKDYQVDPQGSVLFPYLGRVALGGLTTAEAAAELRRGLSDGYFRNPQVRVEVKRPKQVFVFGGVANPGMYPLTNNMTLLEVLVRAGYMSASEAIVVRTEGASGPVLPGENDRSQVIRVNLRELEKDIESGQLSRNVVLEDADTVFVPRHDPNRVFVSGQVRNQGAYSVPEGTTVLQVLTLAGGHTEYAALGRIRILRLEGGKQRNLKAKLGDVVRPGDTIVVPERWF